MVSLDEYAQRTLSKSLKWSALHPDLGEDLPDLCREDVPCAPRSYDNTRDIFSRECAGPVG